MIGHGAAVAEQYAKLAEQNANAHTGEVFLQLSNRIERDRAADREDLHQYIDQRIDQKINKAKLGESK